MNFQQMPFGVMPFPMPFQQQQQNIDEAPARVRLAVDFLTNLSLKTMPRPASNEHVIEVVDGQKLSDEEVAAQATACNMLSQYFAGKLIPDRWEQIDFDVQQRSHPGSNSPGMYLKCIMCIPGPVNPKCKLCNGNGEILVFPVPAGHYKNEE